jgi:iron complex transport system substrate-binding protein
MSRIICAFLCLLFAGCKQHSLRNNDSNTIQYRKTKYAQGFEIYSSDEGTILRVKNPWQQAENVIYEYKLTKNRDIVYQKIPEIRCFKVPVEKVVCLSTTFIGFIDILEKEHTVKGISGAKYVTSPLLARKIDIGEIPDVGYDNNLNYELLLQIKPDVVFVYGISSSVASVIGRLDEMGIRSVVIAEYLEETPLAKLEWLRFIATFYDLEKKADIIVDSIASSYEKLVALAKNQTDKPSVLLGLPWNGTWYVSGGKSYTASLIRDAGGEYIWNNLPFNDSRPISIEKVFSKAYNVDFWLNTGDANNKNDILKTEERFKELKAFKHDALYNNNNQLNPAGGNAYFEKGVVEPDIILADIISILHPRLLPSHLKKYYRKLE